MKYLVMTLVMLSLLGCGDKDREVRSTLFSILNESTDGQEQYKACILLAELPADDGMIEKLKEEGAQASFCRAYLLAKYQVSPVAINAFISSFPLDSQLSTLWKTHTEAGYILGILPPAVQLLSELARTHDLALDKLVSLLPFADGAYAESIIDDIADMYIRESSRVGASLKRMNSSEEDILLIKRISEYKRNL